MKSIYTFAFSIICLFITTTVCSQELTDREIGFNEAQVIVSLQEHGITDPEEVNREVEHIRETNKEQYIVMKKREEEILQRIQPRQLLKAGAIADIPQSEKDALKALYDSTNGANWKNKTGWDFSTPVISWNAATNTGWYGITITNGHITSLSLIYNNLNGFMPTQIGQLNSLVLLKLEGNTLSGNIPSDICKLTNLAFLSLEYNDFSGPLPSQIGNLSLLESLKLSGNKLTEIPLSFYNLIKLSVCSLTDNSFSGEISPEISKLINLEHLFFSWNKFSAIPLQIGQLNKLIDLELSFNEIGVMPKEIGQLQNLKYLNLDNNKLKGQIPSEIGLVSKLESLFLNYNQLEGSIPDEIRNLKNLKSLRLRSNQLEDLLPDLTNLNLTSLDITNNNFRFVDFENQFLSLKLSLLSNFYYDVQRWTDTPKTISAATGRAVTLIMCEDNRFTANDTFQWYKDNSPISGAVSRTYTLTNAKTTDTGTYTCRSYHNINPDMSSLWLLRHPITLNVFNCTPITGTLKVL
ncbi:immunoglobulin domain-containing protein [Flavobacterium sp. MMLR14_040]|uniref:leucine-rich repeat domain-containing protein n=1 Tax=Flavobacterium sp. MMLR14_040 TaxID=3093843 RepID=UPI0029902BEE|nr:immunoglobulin domain-containing protein [Flavobacterium sp. MMLR14_040]MDW8850106.1 immunoglobulin domain-containing protein [Flavobacterium sp. MMLR14_040]